MNYRRAILKSNEKQIAELALENANLAMEILHLKAIVIEFQKRELAEKIPALKMEVSNYQSSGTEISHGSV